MLWETTDAMVALKTRFGFANAEDAVAWVDDALRKHWGMESLSCRRLVLSDHNALAWVETSEDALVVKWTNNTSRFDKLHALAELTGWLSSRDLPVSHHLPALDGSMQLRHDGASLSVQRHVDGGLLEVADPGQVAAAGRLLAHVQNALRDYPHPSTVDDPNSHPVPMGRHLRSWLEIDHPEVPAGVLQRLAELVEGAPPEPRDTQLVHGDLRSANVLCRGVGIAALLDFEESHFENPVTELARACVLLGTRFRDWAPIPYSVQRNFLDAYETVRPLTSAERYWCHMLVLWLTALFIPEGDDPQGWAQAAQRLSHRR